MGEMGSGQAPPARIVLLGVCAGAQLMSLGAFEQGRPSNTLPHSLDRVSKDANSSKISLHFFGLTFRSRCKKD